jgi:DNA-binding transcriptional regulator YiaG
VSNFIGQSDYTIKQHNLATYFFMYYACGMRKRKTDKPRDEASQAVIALRNALNMTQQEFAVEAVKTSIGTVAVWETNRPPRGDALLKLADVAWNYGQTGLSDRFETLFLEDVVPRLRSLGIDVMHGDGSGFVLQRYRDRKEAVGTVRLLHNAMERLAYQLGISVKDALRKGRK